MGVIELKQAVVQFSSRSTLLGKSLENVFSIASQNSFTNSPASVKPPSKKFGKLSLDMENSDKKDIHEKRTYYLVANQHYEAEDWIQTIKQVQENYVKCTFR